MVKRQTRTSVVLFVNYIILTHVQGIWNGTGQYYENVKTHGMYLNTNNFITKYFQQVSKYFQRVFSSTNTDVSDPVCKCLDEGILQQCRCTVIVECAAQKRPELPQRCLVLSTVRAGRCVRLAMD